MVGRTMTITSPNAAATKALVQVGGPIAIFNGYCRWIFYVAVSKSYQRAFKKLLVDCCRSMKGNG